MSEPITTILLVDPDAHARARMIEHLSTTGFVLLEAPDGPSAMRILTTRDVKLVVTELYLGTGDDECLVHAIRRQSALRKIWTLAHTHRSTAADREWAMRAGADAYLIKPTRAERFRYVVGRLTSNRGVSVKHPASRRGPTVRRDSLEVALTELESGKGTLAGTASIVFGRAWWERLSFDQRDTYRRRAKRARITLRSDSMLSNHFVEMRGKSPEDNGPSTERPESSYRR